LPNPPVADKFLRLPREMPAQLNLLFYLTGAKPISLGSDSNFNPRNTTSIPVVKIFAFLELDQK